VAIVLMGQFSTANAALNSSSSDAAGADLAGRLRAIDHVTTL
jgi:hypothetical protein